MIEQQQIDFLLKHPMFYPAAAAAGVLILLIVVLKLLISSRSSESVGSREEGNSKLIPGSTKRKKGKKSKLAQEKKAQESPKSKKDGGVTETGARVVEESKNEKKKDGGRSKQKSKKKKNSIIKQEIASVVGHHDESIDGEWQTVSTKEQREQLKREKKKQEEENVAVETTSSSDKIDPMPLIQPSYKTTSNIPAIAKGIAPRFARAAGEQWQGKTPVTVGATTTHSKRPMPPVKVPGVAKQTPKTTTVGQTWAPSTQAKTLWTGGDLGTAWPNIPDTLTASSIPRDFGMTWNPDNNALLNMATSSEKSGLSGWPQGGTTWQSGNGTNNGLSAEDWVHVNDSQNGRNASAVPEGWVGGESPIRNRKPGIGMKKDEEWTLEPEGFPVEPAQPDPNDPWNLELVETGDAGDWSAPVSSWDNTNGEWKAPSPVKHEPTYIDESSDEEKYSTVKSTMAHHQGGHSITTSALPQSVVGAGPEFLNQAAAQGQGKKSKRRRKKKQTTTSEPDPSTQASSPHPSDESQAQASSATITKKEDMVPEPKKNDTPASQPTEKPEVSAEISTDDWTVPKTTKKRKTKARKAD